MNIKPIIAPVLRLSRGPVVFRFTAKFEGDKAKGRLIQAAFGPDEKPVIRDFKAESAEMELIGNEKLAADLESYKPGGKYVGLTFLLKASGKRLRWKGRQLNEIMVSEVSK
jgi:hypothetical protein